MYQKRLLFSVPQGSTLKLSFTIYDDNGVVLPAASLLTFTLTLYEETSGQILNARDHVNVLNLNGGTVDALGNATMTLLPADGVLVATSTSSEVHVAQFEWTYSNTAGTQKGIYQISFVLYAVPNL